MAAHGIRVEKTTTRQITRRAHTALSRLCIASCIALCIAAAVALPAQAFPIVTQSGAANAEQLASTAGENNGKGSASASQDGVVNVAGDLCDHAKTLIQWAEEGSADYQLGQNLEASYCAEYHQDAAFYAEQYPVGVAAGSTVNAGDGVADAGAGNVAGGAPMAANGVAMPRLLATGPQEKAFSGQANMMPTGQQSAPDTARVLRQGASLSTRARQQPAQPVSQEPSPSQESNQEPSQDMNATARELESAPPAPIGDSGAVSPAAASQNPAAASQNQQSVSSNTANQGASVPISVFNSFPERNDGATRLSSGDDPSIGFIDPNNPTPTVRASAPPVFVMLLTLLLASALLNRRAA